MGHVWADGASVRLNTWGDQRVARSWRRSQYHLKMEFTYFMWCLYPVVVLKCWFMLSYTRQVWDGLGQRERNPQKTALHCRPNMSDAVPGPYPLPQAIIFGWKSCLDIVGIRIYSGRLLGGDCIFHVWMDESFYLMYVNGFHLWP